MILNLKIYFCSLFLCLFVSSNEEDAPQYSKQNDTFASGKFIDELSLMSNESIEEFEYKLSLKADLEEEEKVVLKQPLVFSDSLVYTTYFFLALFILPLKAIISNKETKYYLIYCCLKILPYQICLS